MRFSAQNVDRYHRRLEENRFRWNEILHRLNSQYSLMANSINNTNFRKWKVQLQSMNHKHYVVQPFGAA